MKRMISSLRPACLLACLALVLAAPASHADIYKWVDADGKTHYSERKEDAGKSKVEEVKIKSSPETTNTATRPGWQEQEAEFRQRQIQRQQEEAKANKPAPVKPRQLYSEKPETDASRCEMAKDILGGKLVHGNGAKTDANDRMIAERDKSRFCH
ncbi:DUF4124 domain-containing protein [Undibacterium sp. TS12]|uniref:DUF4124 domain-containing protein n=1 Tax=Undibacterium sp. TS12 TaxID=2908202 RepID=UPI001F4D2FB6|nr:DUF4124 domain-containing protein [Undibacterium sp. TS12]MCH8620276.1 DUF4124 domain-containing protein [Undibacterium sp. TS12]